MGFPVVGIPVRKKTAKVDRGGCTEVGAMLEASTHYETLYACSHDGCET
jgi:hypothetical protein